MATMMKTQTKIRLMRWNQENAGNFESQEPMGMRGDKLTCSNSN